MPENRLKSGVSAVSAYNKSPLRSDSAAGIRTAETELNFDHLLEFTVFCPALVFRDVAELVQQRQVDAQCVPAQVVLHFVVPP